MTIDVLETARYILMASFAHLTNLAPRGIIEMDKMA